MLSEEVVLPGLVNVHTHLELTRLRGRVPEVDFFAWIQHLRRAKESMDFAGFMDAAGEGIREMWRYGTTTVADTGTSGAAARALAQLGGRGIYYQEAIAPEPERCEEAFRSLTEAVESLRSEVASQVRIGVSPHAPYTVSPALYAKVARFARSEGMPLAAHVAESQAEVDLVTRMRGPFARSWRERGISLPEPSRSAVGHLQRVGLLGEDLLAVHAVRVDDSDIALLGECGVAIAVCLRSNLRHGHGSPKLRQFLQRGIRCGLGTDSVVSVESLDLLAEARAACELAKLSATEAIRLSTLGGAAALGMDGEVGSLERGKWADLCVLQLEPVVRSEEQLARAIIDAGSAAISRTYSAGRLVHQAEFPGSQR